MLLTGHRYFAKSKGQNYENLERSCLLLALSSPAVAQTVEVKAKPLTDADIQLIRQDVQAQKKQIITKLTDAMVSIEGENARPVTWVVIDEVRSGEWGIGGKPLTTEDALALLAGKN